MAYDGMASKNSGDLVTAANWNQIGTNFTAILPCEIIAVFDGGVSAITTGTTVDIPIDFKCTITAADLLLSGGYASDATITADVWRDESTDYPPTSDDYITGSAKLVGSTVSGQRASINIATWTTGLNAGDVLRFYVESCSLISKATARISVNRSS